MTARDTGMPKLLTADEVAAWLKTTRKAVYAKAERGTLAGGQRGQDSSRNNVI